MTPVKYVAYALLLAMLAGCASEPISRDLRRQATPVTFNQVKADPEGTRGTVVIWGGRIINVVNDTNGATLYILSLPLHSDGRPRNDQPSPGRFIATSSDFVDPEMFPPGSAITVAGQLNGVWTEPLENIEYTYPLVYMRETHIWQEREPPPPNFNSGPNWSVYVGPSWYVGPGWGPGWDPRWGSAWGTAWGPGWGWYGSSAFHGPPRRGPPRSRPPPPRRGPPPRRNSGSHWRAGPGF